MQPKTKASIEICNQQQNNQSKSKEEKEEEDEIVMNTWYIQILHVRIF